MSISLKALSYLGASGALLGLGSCGHPRPVVDPATGEPLIHAGCEQVQLYEPHHSVPFEFRVLREISVSWSDRSRDLRSWLVNEACSAGAEGVVQVLETVQSDESGLPVYKMGGLAVVFDPRRPHVGPAPAHLLSPVKADSPAVAGGSPQTTATNAP